MDHDGNRVEMTAARLYDVFRRAIVGEHAFSGEGDMPDLDRLDPVVHQAWLRVAEELASQQQEDRVGCAVCAASARNSDS